MKNVSFYISEYFQCLEVKFCIDLNWRADMYSLLRCASNEGRFFDNLPFITLCIEIVDSGNNFPNAGW